MRGVALLFALALGGTSHASPGAVLEAVALRYDAPATCPAEAALRSRLEAKLGGGAVASAEIDIAVVESAGGFELSLEIRSDGHPSGRRALSSASCDELIDAAVLILALALVPAPAPQEVDDEQAPRFGSRPIPRRPAAVEPEQSVAVAASEPVVGRLGAIVAVDGGTLPGLAGGLGLIGALHRGSGRIAIGFAYFPRQREAIEEDPDVGGDIEALSVVARGCGRVGPVWLCGGGEWNRLTGVGVGVEEPETTVFSLWGVTAAGRYERRFGRMAVSAITEIVAHPERPRYSLDNPSRLVYRPGWLSARFWLQAEVEIF